MALQERWFGPSGLNFAKKKEKENSQLFDFQRESFHFRRETSGIGP